MTLHTGDCLDVMPTLAAGSVDAVVTDPPYNLTDIGRRFMGNGGTLRPDGGRRSESRGGGFMGREWDGTGIAFDPATWEAVGRVAKPGAYLLAFGGTRTVHRMTCAIEDAGWVIRDVLVWAYAQGFPKSRASLKPAWEPIVMARKPGLSSPLQIDAARIGVGADKEPAPLRRGDSRPAFTTADSERLGGDDTLGRWPANVVLTDPIFDGDVPGVVGGGWQSGGGNPRNRITPVGNGITLREGFHAIGPTGLEPTDTDGTYSRFFLIPKADRAEREPIWGSGLEERAGGAYANGVGMPGRTLRDGEWVQTGTWAEPNRKARVNGHPTVKPLDLMRHLVRLVTPPGGTVLDCFAGSGTTLLACEMEGFDWIGIEREESYVEIIKARLAGVQRGFGLSFGDPAAALETPVTQRVPIEGVDLQLLAGMAGPAEGDEVA